MLRQREALMYSPGQAQAALTPPATADDAVALLDRLRSLHDLAELLRDQPPEGWTRDDVTMLASFAALLESRLFLAAPYEIRQGYLRLLADIGR